MAKIDLFTSLCVLLASNSDISLISDSGTGILDADGLGLPCSTVSTSKSCKIDYIDGSFWVNECNRPFMNMVRFL